MVAKISNVTRNCKPVILIYQYWSFGRVRKFSDLFPSQAVAREFIRFTRMELDMLPKTDRQRGSFKVLERINLVPEGKSQC